LLPELGFLALLSAALLAVLQGVLPWLGLRLQRGELTRIAWPLAYANALLLGLALVLLACAFAGDDFSVAYVAQHSNSRLPLFYKIAAVWGGHEGSMLFFVFAIALWNALVAARSASADPAVTVRVLATLGMIVAAFSFFVLLASNPFLRLFPAPFEGRDLNPMLQDIALIFHPPLLYLGYVGFSVSFAYALAALLSGRFDSAVIHWSRPWALASWIFLTVGIALGSWWAYYELGWGGWWFWDPVENASLLPWLTGTALLHALAVCEKRGAFSAAVLLLSIFTFALSLLGTFVVRSGMMSSVHAFAVAPGRGIMLLLLFGVLLTLALGLFALRAGLRPSPARFTLLSKEAFLGLAIVLPSVAAACVLLGTFYPLAYKMLTLGVLSVGAPYFNRIFVPLCLLLLAALAFAPWLRWKKLPAIWWRVQLLSLLAGAPAALWLCLRQPLPTDFVTWLACTLACWVIVSHAVAIAREHGGRRLGMHLTHLGIAFAVIGAAQVSQYSDERQVAMTREQPYPLGAFIFTLETSEAVIGPNYTAERLSIAVEQDGGFVARLFPERRHYSVREMTMSESAIHPGLAGDIYIVAGEKLATDTYAVHLRYKPMMSWLWLGACCMMLGGTLTLLRRRPSRLPATELKLCDA